MDQIWLAAPEIVLAAAICVVLLVDVFLRPEQRQITYLLSMLALIAAAGASIFATVQQPTLAFSGSFIADPAGGVLKLVAYFVVALVFLYSRNHLEDQDLLRGEFFILSLRWTREDLITWWCPNNSGYTCVLEQAGRYTREQVEQLPGYYNNGETTLALPCAEVEAEAVRVVYGLRLEKLTSKRFRNVTDQDDEDAPSCNACGWSPAAKVLGLRVVQTDYRRATFGQCVGRALLSILVIMTYGAAFLSAMRRPGYRAVHDALSGTTVVRTHAI